MLPSIQSRLRKASSVGTGTTVIVRAPLPSADGPTVRSMALPAVFSKALYKLVGGASGRLSTASRYSPALTFRPGSVSGARRAGFQFKPPYTFLKR
ncbi:hypothetical protein D3C72_1716940 [compost metagenome]